MTIDLKTLSEMPSAEEWRLKLSKSPRRSTTSTTVTAVGSPLTDPNGVKEGRYSYSETGGIPDGMTQEEYDKATKEFMKFSEMTPEQIEEMLDTMSKTTSPIKESNPMTRREELETKGVSQLMAEWFAKGVPRGAYSENSFEKGHNSRANLDKLASLYDTDYYIPWDMSVDDMMAGAKSDPELAKVLTAYLSDPDVKIAIDSMVSGAKWGTYTDNSDPNDEGALVNPLKDARSKLNKAGVEQVNGNVGEAFKNLLDEGRPVRDAFHMTRH